MQPLSSLQALVGLFRAVRDLIQTQFPFFVPPCVFVRNEQDLLKTQNLKTQKKPSPKRQRKKELHNKHRNNHSRWTDDVFAIEFGKMNLRLMIVLLHGIQRFLYLVEA